MKFDIYSGDEKLRFVLGKTGKNPLFVVGLNPSTADGHRADPTINKVQALAGAWKFDSFVMLNLYPLRASKPTMLPNIFDVEQANLNFDVVRRQLVGKMNPVIWVAWGNGIVQQSYFSLCLQGLAQATKTLDVDWRQCGELTIKKHPRHPNPQENPLIKTVERGLIPFDFYKYIARTAL